jgi:glycosyltransferase involved in cell wall biosynthesis
MHVLLTTSEELNEENKLGSIFELAQAKSLQAAGIKTAIISVGYFTSVNVLKALLWKIRGKAYGYYRLNDISIPALLTLLGRTIFASFLGKTYIRRLNIEGVTVYEALFHKIHFRLNQKGHDSWVNHGFKAVKSYINDFGKPDLIHAHSRFLLGALLAQKVLHKNGVQYVMTEHSTFYGRKLIKDFQVPLLKNVIAESRELIVVSSELSKAMNEFLKTDFSAIVIPNVIDPIFDNIPLGQQKASVFIFLNIASLDPKKDQTTLIKAFAYSFKGDKQVILKIGGDGAEKENLFKITEELGIKEQVIFLGVLSHEKVKEEMMGCNVFVLSSLNETFGVVLIEALACGKPVISTRSGGPEDFINDNNGILIPVEDEKALGEAMLEMKKNYQNYDSQTIRNNCLAKFSGQSVASQLINLYSCVQKKVCDNNN